MFVEWNHKGKPQLTCNQIELLLITNGIFVRILKVHELASLTQKICSWDGIYVGVLISLFNATLGHSHN
jgi:hypothetical protein